MPAAPVLDSFALLAFLRGEAGDDKVAALARKHKAELVTGDPEFKAVEKEIKIVWLRDG